MRPDDVAYVIVDVYPDIGSEHFVNYAGAIAGCWVRDDTARAKGGLASIVEEMIVAAGWKIARTLSTERVSRASYDDDSEDVRIGRARFEQALTDGFVVQFNTRRRELILPASPEQGDDEEILAVAAHEQFVQAVRSAGAVSLYSQPDGQWANGVSPDGDEFFPIWIQEASTRAWLHGWPDYEVVALDRDSAIDDMLTAINEADMWAGIEVGRNVLMTTHPILLRDLLKGPPRRGALGSQ